ncbi:aminotransferase class I/II-fold pyridoxal phosphate-dependent enzyme [Marinifilum caeruleilacunae]|uniref:Pyridoxal phosphate-dependent aminotransferase family protein n=1 Tax=Marinifilum caeruleilacunae TaxID=2499076 RepID=A0ABX1WQI5_9BACT|nr:pyridoxal phosphate-dependent aminotransferase family protein [Marinifilum caeruleilacunae]NOU58350.1 pyridoxal phosphate-dependent aminotransferase family protein [Marinifilum caeruleilacunae]
MNTKNSPFKYILDGPTGSSTRIHNKDMLYFAGVGYFQLQNHPEIIQASIDALQKYGVTAATSRAGIGTTDLLLELDQKIAEYFDTEDAVYLPSGYLSNMAGIQALKAMKKFDVIFMDEVVHYCNEEAALTTGLPIYRFKSRDAEDLENQIKTHLKGNERPLIVSDGMFPVWAWMAPIPEYLKIAEKYDGIIWLDDAHPVGIIGEHGRGTYDYHKLKSERLYMGATLSKAFGAYGGFVPGSEEFIYHVKHGHIVDGATSPVSAAAGAALKGLQLVSDHPEWRDTIRANAMRLKNGLRQLGIEVENNDFPVTSFKIGNAEQMQAIHAEVLKRNIYIQYTKYIGAGPEGVLRTVMFSTHSNEQIDLLLDNLKEII